MNRKNSGRIVVKDIGIPKEAEKFVGPGELVYYPIPKKTSKKGDSGRVLIVGGGPYTGAPVLAALAAYRIGVDLVHLAVPSAIYQIIASFSPNFIVYPIGNKYLSAQEVSTILKLIRKLRIDSVLLGPGLGKAKETKLAIEKLTEKIDIPLVIDANAFDFLTLEDLENKLCIATPHAREFEKFTNLKLPKELDARTKLVEKISRNTGIVILLKASTDIISDGKSTKLNPLGNVGMTVGGTGDTLAGIVAGLLAKGVKPFRAACLGVFINCYAGELAFKEKTYSLLATDLIEKIPEVLKEFL
jgi:NAD(P)H-hydrate epimerase